MVNEGKSRLREFTIHHSRCTIRSAHDLVVHQGRRRRHAGQPQLMDGTGRTDVQQAARTGSVAKVGGTHRMSFTNFSTGQSHTFGGTYTELVPNERIRYTDKFDDPNMPGEIQASITLKKVSCGTELNIVQEGVPDVIPAEMCYLGWQESLILLAKLVEAEIPD